MPAKPAFNEDQLEILHAAAQRVFRKKFKVPGEDAPQDKMALALGITQQSVSKLLKGIYRPGVIVAKQIATLDGRESLEDLVGDFADPTPTVASATKPGIASGGSGGTFANLDICIQFHSATKHWSPWTVAAARAGFFGNADFAPPEWVGKLDGLERALERARKVG